LLANAEQVYPRALAAAVVVKLEELVITISPDGLLDAADTSTVTTNAVNSEQ